jgi:hypothetical protein
MSNLEVSQGIVGAEGDAKYCIVGGDCQVLKYLDLGLLRLSFFFFSLSEWEILIDLSFLYYFIIKIKIYFDQVLNVKLEPKESVRCEPGMLMHSE